MRKISAKYFILLSDRSQIFLLAMMKYLKKYRNPWIVFELYLIFSLNFISHSVLALIGPSGGDVTMKIPYWVDIYFSLTKKSVVHAARHLFWVLLGTLTLLVALTNVDVYVSFFSFRRPELSPWGYRSRIFFLVVLSCLVAEKTEFGNSDQEPKNQCCITQHFLNGWFMVISPYPASVTNVGWINMHSFLVTFFEIKQFNCTVLQFSRI